MSLRGRIIAWNLAALILSLALTALIAGINARRSVANEVSSAMASASRSLQHASSGAQEVYPFDGDRHLRVSYFDRRGVLQAQSKAAEEPATTPGWAARALTSDIAPLTLDTGQGRFVIEAVSDNEIHEAWAHGRDVALFPLLTALLLAAIIGFSIERALRPLQALRAGLGAIGAGDFSARVATSGPAEVADLLHGFNKMGGQLAAAESRNRALLHQLERVQEEERADLARDLHDEVGSYLFAARVDCQTIVRLAKDGRTDKLGAQAEAVQDAIAHVQAHVRALLERLRADPAYGLRLTEGLRDLVEFWRLRTPETEFLIDVDDEEPEFDSAQVTNLYRVTQEALTNAVRHGAATTIKVSLARSGDFEWDLTIRDNGRGGEGMPVEPGFGLTGMRERVVAAGGVLDAGPAGDGGWTVRARVPQRRVFRTGGGVLEDTAG